MERRNGRRKDEGDGIAFEGRGVVMDREHGDGGGCEHVRRSRHGWKLSKWGRRRSPLFVPLKVKTN